YRLGSQILAPVPMFVASFRFDAVAGNGPTYFSKTQTSDLVLNQPSEVELLTFLDGGTERLTLAQGDRPFNKLVKLPFESDFGLSDERASFDNPIKPGCLEGKHLRSRGQLNYRPCPHPGKGPTLEVRLVDILQPCTDSVMRRSC